MTVSITIIGTGKIGTSIGLALQSHTEQLHRTGHDIDPQHARQAAKMGALDKVKINLHASVENANLVILALPFDQIRETIELIAPDLKRGTVVMDTSPAKQAVAAWAQELLPEGRHYIGLTPVLNSEYLNDRKKGPEGAKTDLFSKGIMGIVSPQGADSDAIKLAADLSKLLGAKPLFLDMVEIDSLISSTHLIPQLLAAGMVSATMEQPGWQEGRKLAGAAYSQICSSIFLQDTPGSLSEASTSNHEYVVRVMDDIIVGLQSIRNLIADKDIETLNDYLIHANESGENWWHLRQKSEWELEGQSDVNTPSLGNQLRNWLLGGRNRN